VYVSNDWYDYRDSIKRKRDSAFLGPTGWRAKMDNEINEAQRNGDEASAIEQSRLMGNGWDDTQKSVRYTQLQRELQLKRKNRK
jgi:hypothetical protein